MDRRLHESCRDRDARSSTRGTARSACNVAIGVQREVARLLRSRRSACSSTTSASTTSRGCGVSSSTEDDCSPSCSSVTGTRSRGTPRSRCGSSRSSARSRPPTCGTSTRTTPSSRSSATGCLAPPRWPRSRRLLDIYRDAEVAEKPALLEQRGGAFYSEAATALIASLSAGSGDVQVVDVRNVGSSRAFRTTTSSSSRASAGRTAPRRCRSPARARASRARAARRRLRAAHRRGGGDS